jgi:hypothetical protein
VTVLIPLIVDRTRPIRSSSGFPGEKKTRKHVATVMSLTTSPSHESGSTRLFKGADQIRLTKRRRSDATQATGKEIDVLGKPRKNDDMSMNQQDGGDLHRPGYCDISKVPTDLVWKSI